MQIRNTMLIRDRIETDELGAPCDKLIRVPVRALPCNPVSAQCPVRAGYDTTKQGRGLVISNSRGLSTSGWRQSRIWKTARLNSADSLALAPLQMPEHLHLHPR